MPTAATSINRSAIAFLDALYRYQRATRDVNRSLNRLNASLIEFSHPLKGVVQRSAPALAGRANPIGRK